jgi:hypothetical protein
MKALIWSLSALLALLWTGLAAAVAAIVRWTADNLGQAPIDAVGTAAGSLAIPAWLAPWIDAAGWGAAQEAVTAWVTALSAALPFVGTAVGWLVPAVWLTWGLGIVVLLVLTLLAVWLLGRAGKLGSLTPRPA